MSTTPVSNSTASSANAIAKSSESLETPQTGKKAATGTNVNDVPTQYSKASAPSEADVQAFLDAFAHDSSVYSLINHLNNTLKNLFRELSESEAEFRIGRYISQFETALEKRDATLEAAEEILELKLDAAKKKRNMGIAQIAQGVLGVQGQISQGAFTIVQSKIEVLDALAKDVEMQLSAKNAEFDGKMNLDRQEADLANSQVAFADQLNSIFSSLINDLHANHNATVGALSKGMV